ncbi:MAG: polysaccharide biosynthesis/export family protein [Candidatus Korobacteraceae bacterium]
MGKRIFIVTAIMLLGLWTLAAYGQDNAAQQGSDSAPAAQPVIPDSSSSSANSGKDVAKTTTLPSTGSPHPHVANVRPDTYVIGVGDVLDVNVWKEGELSKVVGVRTDGMITLPLIGEIKATGLTPVQLQEQITASLSKVMSDPQVVVMVGAVNSMSFNIMGQVYKPGFFPLSRPITILDAIALSGGFRDFAKQKKIYILRAAPDGTQQKIHFNYKQVIKGQNMSQNILVEPHDTIVVP